MQCEFDPDRSETGTSGGVADVLARMRFDWQSHCFDAVLKRGTGQVCNLTVTSDLGSMPYSADGLMRRVNTFAVLRAARGGVPIRIDFTKTHRLKLTAKASLPNPVTAKATIAGVTTLILQASPYLNMIHMLQPVSVRSWQ